MQRPYKYFSDFCTNNLNYKKFGLSYSINENVVTEIHLPGESVGFKRIWGELLSKQTKNKLPFGLLADKMSSK